jgi:hypothetical protein
MPNVLPYTDYELKAVIHDNRYDVMYSYEEAKELAEEIQREFKTWLFQRFKLRPDFRFEGEGDEVVRVPEISVTVVKQGWA